MGGWGKNFNVLKIKHGEVPFLLMICKEQVVKSICQVSRTLITFTMAFKTFYFENNQKHRFYSPQKVIFSTISIFS